MIALDVMGGDNAPEVTLRGSLQAAQEGIPVLLYGPEIEIVSQLDVLDPNWKTLPLEISDAPEIVGMDEDPVSSFKKKQNSSMICAVQAVKTGKAGAAVSAGNSGAFMIAATLLLGRQKNIERPAIAGFLPVKKGFVLGLDLGANTNVRPQHLLDFARLGSAYVAQSCKIDSPRVALLSNGHEASKGSELVKQAHQLLKDSELNFIGNAEPYHVMNGDMDVLVCDGFSGNVLLKTWEVVSSMSLKLFEEQKAYVLQHESDAVKQKLQDSYGKISKKVTEHLDYKKFGGAPLLGVNGNIFVCHGASDARSIKNAIIFAYRSIQQ